MQAYYFKVKKSQYISGIIFLVKYLKGSQLGRKWWWDKWYISQVFTGEEGNGAGGCGHSALTVLKGSELNADKEH